MPYGNFGDNFTIKQVYDEQQRLDPNLNMGEFVFEKLLCIGQIIDSVDDDDEAPHDLPLKDQQPQLAMQIQAGFLDCTKTIIGMQESPAILAKTSCLFKENMFSFDFHAPVFHPPVYIA